MKRGIVFFVLLFIVVGSTTALDTLDMQGKLKNTTDNTALSGQYEYNVTYFNVTTNEFAYSENKTITVDTNGVWNYIVGLDNLIPIEIWRSKLYINLSIDGEMLSPVNLTTVPYSFYSHIANNSDYLGGVIASSYITSASAVGTEIYAGIEANVTLLNNNITAILANLTSINHSMGLKLEAGNLLPYALDSDVNNNWSNLNNNDSQIWTNITSINNSLGIKLESGDLLAYALDTDIANNWSNINDNLTQIWLNISAINNSKTSGGGGYVGVDVYTGIEQNITNVRADWWDLSNATAFFNSIYNLTNPVEATNLADNVTALRLSINQNATNLKANDTQIWLNITSLNKTLGQKLDAENLDAYALDSDVNNNWSNLNDNDTQILLNLTSINHSLGIKLESGDLLAYALDTDLVNNWTNIQDNLTQLWINISAINNSKTSGGGGVDGSKIANNTDAILTNLTIVENLTVQGLISCDTIDTDSTGRLTCGVDDSGSGVGTIIHDGIEQNITNVIGNIDTNITLILNNLTQLWINISAINNSKTSGSGAVAGAYGYENFSADYTTYGGFKVENMSDVVTSIENNWTNLVANDTQLWTNISILNTTLGIKANRDEIVTIASIQEVNAGIEANITLLNSNITQILLNLTSINNSLGLKLEAGDLLPYALDSDVNNNWTNLNNNLSIVWGNLSSLNNSLGIKLEAIALLPYALDSDVNNNWSNLLANDTQIWINITSLNSTLGQKYDRGDSVADGTKIANNTDANIKQLNVSVFNTTLVKFNNTVCIATVGDGTWLDLTGENCIAGSSSKNIRAGIGYFRTALEIAQNVKFLMGYTDTDKYWWYNSPSDQLQLVSDTEINFSIVDKLSINHKVNISTSGDVNATKFYGDGSALSGITVAGAYNFENFSADYTTYGGFKLTNVTFIVNNLSQLWINISDINHSLGIKLESGDLLAYALDSDVNNNWTNLVANDTQLWLNITALNTSLGLKLETDDDSAYLKNNTDATLINITTTELRFNTDTTNHYIADNATCIIIKGDTAEIHVC